MRRLTFGVYVERTSRSWTIDERDELSFCLVRDEVVIILPVDGREGTLLVLGKFDRRWVSVLEHQKFTLEHIQGYDSDKLPYHIPSI